MQISGLPDGITADGFHRFANRSNRRIVFVDYDTGSRDGIVGFDSYADLKAAMERLNGSEFRGARVTCLMF
jgi:hypothetical protein